MKRRKKATDERDHDADEEALEERRGETKTHGPDLELTAKRSVPFSYHAFDHGEEYLTLAQYQQVHQVKYLRAKAKLGKVKVRIAKVAWVCLG